MPAKKFLSIVSGVKTLFSGVQSSAGAGNAGDLVALDETGRIDESMMPSGLGAETVIAPASENLAAGDKVDLWMDGTLKVRKADATAAGKPADGFVKASVISGENATVYMPGQRLGGLTGLTPDADYYLSTTPGQMTTTPPSASGNVIQKVGKSLSEGELFFRPEEPIVIA